MVTVIGIQEQLIKLFRDQFHLDVPSVDTDLLETGLLDSLHFVELLLHLEQDFGMKVDAAALDLDQFRSIASIAAYLVPRTTKSPVNSQPPTLIRAA